jgi:hypothetical protein
MLVFLAILLVGIAIALLRQQRLSDLALDELRQEARTLRVAEATVRRRAETLLVELTATRARAQELTLEMVAARAQGQALAAELVAANARLESIAHLGAIEDALAYTAGLRRVAERELENAKRVHREAERQTETSVAHTDADRARLVADGDAKLREVSERGAATLAPGEVSVPLTKGPC